MWNALRISISRSAPTCWFSALHKRLSNGLPVGSIGAGKASSAFDTATITGAIEYIIAKVHEQSPDTKVVLYTCTVNSAYGKYNEYSAFVNGMLKQIEKKVEGYAFRIGFVEHGLYQRSCLYASGRCASEQIGLRAGLYACFHQSVIGYYLRKKEEGIMKKDNF